MFEVLLAIASGAVGGVVWGLVGYSKQATDPNGENFDITKMGKSVVIGAVLGGIAGFSGTTVDAVAVGTLGLTVTPIIEKIYGAILGLWKRK